MHDLLRSYFILPNNGILSQMIKDVLINFRPPLTIWWLMISDREPDSGAIHCIYVLEDRSCWTWDTQSITVGLRRSGNHTTPFWLAGVHMGCSPSGATGCDDVNSVVTWGARFIAMTTCDTTSDSNLGFVTKYTDGFDVRCLVKVISGVLCDVVQSMHSYVSRRLHWDGWSSIII